jgi:elongation factor P
MKIIANDIRAGNVLEYQGKLWVVAKTPDHVMPGKGGAFVQVEMKDIRTGTKLNERFRSNDTVEKVHLDEKPYQYLFTEGDFLTLMDLESFEQISVPKDKLGDAIAYLQDNMQVQVCSHNESVLSLTLPETIIATIAQTEPVLKGQTATASYKPAILDNGVRVMVPPFVNQDDRIVVRTADSTYVERAKD